jgi:hypothetical protein
MKTKYINESDAEFWGSSFYNDSVKANWKYIKSSQLYYEEYFKNQYTDKSFFVQKDNKILAVVFIHFNQTAELSYFGMPVEILTCANLDFKEENEIAKLVIKKLNEIIEKYKCKAISYYGNLYFNHNFFNSDNQIKVEFCAKVDLRLSEEVIFSNIRRRYKSLINWGKKNLIIQTIDQKNIDEMEFEFDKFHNFHLTVSGRRTRSIETWEIQKSAIYKGGAFLILAYINSEIVSGIYVFKGSEEAYYAVGVNDRSLMEENKPIAHHIMFEAISYAKANGCLWFNLGYFISDNSSDKESSIFNFKKGFTNQICINQIIKTKLNVE